MCLPGRWLSVSDAISKHAKNAAAITQQFTGRLSRYLYVEYIRRIFFHFPVPRNVKQSMKQLAPADQKCSIVHCDYVDFHYYQWRCKFRIKMKTPCRSPQCIYNYDDAVARAQWACFKRLVVSKDCFYYLRQRRSTSPGTPDPVIELLDISSLESIALLI